ncbi:MAG: glycosyltransferase family 4 protein [Firmicutes bacterium]|nr:glycosyltransferase family 4 protein [Bacillota bacterium]
MLSWEYPPHFVGGLGQHVYEITRAMARRGVEVHVLTLEAEGARGFQSINGVNVHRVAPYHLSTPDFITWILQINVSFLEKALALLPELGKLDLVHGHDWLVAHASRAIKHSQRLPLIATIHATEYGRNNGLHNDMQRYISSVEWFLSFEAWRVIACSLYMRDELQRVFQLPDDKITLIPNGVDVRDFEVVSHYKEELAQFRSQYAHPDEKIVFYVGRLVHEKGVQLLIEAAPKILAGYPQTKLVIAGRGANEGYLHDLARSRGIENRVYFTGYIDDPTRNRLYQCSDVAVCPSLYEPFGMVALEAMAAGAPVVVSDTGGISELVEEGITGLKFNTGSADSLASRVLEIIQQPEKARRMRERAYKKAVALYSWDTIAGNTIELYEDVMNEYNQSIWLKSSARPSLRSYPA